MKELDIFDNDIDIQTLITHCLYNHNAIHEIKDNELICPSCHHKFKLDIRHGRIRDYFKYLDLNKEYPKTYPLRNYPMPQILNIEEK